MLCFAYMSVEQMSEEHNKEELDRRVYPQVSPQHCTDVHFQFSYCCNEGFIMAVHVKNFSLCSEVDGG